MAAVHLMTTKTRKMNLPTKYKWIETTVPLPKLIAAALQYLGIKEIPGHASNPVILAMAKEIGVDDIYKNDDTSWCALFASYLCKITGKPMIDVGNDRYNYLRAASFAKWGNPVVRGEEMFGDTLVFVRPGGHHVGYYIAESKTTFHVLGGNQSNAVTITEIAKVRLVACRRYYHTAPPATVKKYFMDASGLLSHNEA